MRIENATCVPHLSYSRFVMTIVSIVKVSSLLVHVDRFVKDEPTHQPQWVLATVSVQAAITQ